MAPPWDSAAQMAGFAVRGDGESLDGAGARARRAQRSWSSMPLPPAFAQRWERYKKMHRAHSQRGLRQGPFSAAAAAAADAGDAAVRAELAAASALADACRGSIVVSPVGQLGNRVLPIASAFVLGMLTDRAVYARFRDSYYAGAEDLFADAGISWDAELGMPPSGLPQADVAIALADAQRQALAEELACGPLSAIVRDGATLSISSNQYFAPLLQFNPHYAEALAAIFPDGDLFGPLARALFSPSDAVAGMVEDFKRERGWEGRYVVAMQVRTGGDFTDRGFQQSDWDLLLRCGAALLPAELAAQPERTAFFVATDIDWSRAQAAQQLARLPHTPVWQFGDAWVRSNNPYGCQVAFADVLLLSEANDVVTTAWSTFGYLAAGLTGRADAEPAAGPVLLTELVDAPPPLRDEVLGGAPATYMGVKMHRDARTGCARLPTAQPCYHFLPGQAVHSMRCFGGDSEKGWAKLEAMMREGRYC